MVLQQTVSQLCFLAVICTCLNAAEPVPSVITPDPDVVAPVVIPQAAIEEQPLPGFSIRKVIPEIQYSPLRGSRLLPGCKVAPLSEIWDAEALEFENSADRSPVDVEGLRPDAARALDTLKESVLSLGGTFELKSAYRPEAYQAHLHEVWVKWVKELRNNRSSGCRGLREEVGAEFKRHELLVKQQPVVASDHVLGLAFDAAVVMPRGARLNGKRVTVDKLAALVGIKRPTIRRDPVHFKLLAERPAAISYAEPLAF